MQLQQSLDRFLAPLLKAHSIPVRRWFTKPICSIEDSSSGAGFMVLIQSALRRLVGIIGTKCRGKQCFSPSWYAGSDRISRRLTRVSNTCNFCSVMVTQDQKGKLTSTCVPCSLGAAHTVRGLAE